MSNQIYFNNNNHDNRDNSINTSKNNNNTKLFVEGETVKYVVTKRLSPEQAIITVKGQKLLADISTDKPDRGMAKIISSRGLLLELKIENPNAHNKSALSPNLANNEVVQVLLQNGVKATPENIDYMQKVLKYFPDMNKYHIGLIFSFMSKSVYPTMNQISAFFSDMLLKDLKQQLEKYVNTQKTINYNDKSITVDNLLDSVYNLMFKNNASIDKILYKTLQNNGYYAIICMLLDILELENDQDILKTLKDIIFRLSANRKSKFLKKNVYSVPIILELEGKDRFVEILASEQREKDQNNDDFLLGVLCYDDDSEVLFNIFIKEFFNYYKIMVNIFEKELYLNYKKTESVLEENVYKLFSENEKNVVLEVLFDGQDS